MPLSQAFPTIFSSGVVLAINARLLYKDTQPFEKFLLEFPDTQILVWTGSTEPPISRRKVASIRNRFATGGHCHRVGFDCKVRKQGYQIHVPPTTGNYLTDVLIP